MTSRERVRTVLKKEIPDRVPNALGGCETVGLHVLTYRRLQNVLGLPQTPPKMDTFMCNAVFERDVISAMEGDVLLLASPRMCKADLRGEGAERQWKQQFMWDAPFLVPEADQFTTRKDGSLVWETCGNTVCPKGAYFFDAAEPSDFMGDFDYPDPDDYCPPHELDEKFLRNLERIAKECYETTDLCLSLGETITDLQIQPGGYIGSLLLMKEEPDVMKEFLQKSVDAALAQLKQLDQAVGKYIDILAIAHDFGDNRGVTIGPELWREIYRPYYQQLFGKWKQITHMKINLHSCGSITDILPDLIECGLDIINPLQTSAHNMEANLLKQRFGKDLIFWGGGYDAQLFRPEDDYNAVYQKVSTTIDLFKEGGGYLFGGVHNLPAEISELHLRAMFDAFYDHRNY